MDLPTFTAACRRVWLPAVVAFLVIVAGSFVYVRQRIPPSAQASVAVRDALTVNTTDNSSAAVAFDAIIESDRLAGMVRHQLGRRAGDVKGALSVDTVLPASGIDISPLYVIHAKARTLALAEAIVNAAVTQGRTLYGQLNGSDPAQAEAQVASELQAANATLASATTAYDNFVGSAGGDPSAQITALGGAISALTTQLAQAQAGVSVGTATPAEVAALQGQLSADQQELSALEPAQAQYQQVSTALTDAQTNVQQLTDLQEQTAAAAAVPVADEVKVLDSATPSSNGMLTFLVYALGFILGLLAAFTVIYAEAARQRRRLTSKDLVAALGMSAIGRIPHHAIPRETV